MIIGNKNMARMAESIGQQILFEICKIAEFFSGKRSSVDSKVNF